MAERKNKIAMVAACPLPYPRGTPIRIFRMAEALARSGNDVHLVTYHLGENEKKPEFRYHRTRPIKTYRKLSPGPSWQKLFVLDTLLLLKLVHVLQQYPIDIIHAHHYEGLIVSIIARRQKNCPIVYDAHTLLQSELPFYFRYLPMSTKRAIGSLMDCWLPKRADHVISVTNEIRKKLLTNSGISGERISVISNGVEHRYFQNIPTRSNENRNGKQILIFTGNLAKYQGIEMMLKAFKIVHTCKNNVRLLIVSDSDFTPYATLSRELEISDFIDLEPSNFRMLPHHLSRADVALNPRTDCDGIPQKLLNYMAAGKAIVSFEGSAKNIEDGKNGLIAGNHDIHAFAECVMRLLENSELRFRLGTAAKKRVETNYCWDKVAEKVEGVYRKLVDDKNQ
jgi:glycosyltransferase involved in cell wall biosynthesis